MISAGDLQVTELERAAALAEPGVRPALFALPVVDYQEHPAYQEGRGDRELRRRAVDMMYGVYRDVRVREARPIRRGKRLEDDLDRRFNARGVLGLTMPEGPYLRLQGLMQPHIEALRRVTTNFIANNKPIKFRDSSREISPAGMAEEFAAVVACLEDAGVLQRVARYFRAPQAVVHHVALRDNLKDEAWTRVFKDLKWPAPPLTGMHIDSGTAPYVKILIYLNEVGPKQGPFSYVPGSHRWRQSTFDVCVRKAIDRTKLSSRKPHYRALFSALPPVLQRKADFGADLMPDDPQVAPILAEEKTFTSDKGNAVLFDPQGMHRGGYVKRGYRSVLQITMKATFTPA